MIKVQTRRVFRGLGEPFQRFFRMQASAGILLFFATIIAMAWANSPWGESYRALWDTKLALRIGAWEISKDLLHWINDGLMAIFFFVVGLEIKREIIVGELSSVRQAVLPLSAALGGMIVPAVIFLSLNTGKPGVEGWGIPMATDIAFSLGVLSLLGRRVPLSLKIFLTAFAIVDDIGAVLVIAIFYSHQIQVTLLLIALGLFILVMFGKYAGIRAIPFYMIFGWAIWYLFLKSGIHPTIAGVLMAIAIPARRKIRAPLFVRRVRTNLDEFCEEDCDDDLILNNEQLAAVDNMESYLKRVQSPLQSLEHRLHPWVTFFIMPVFALANAGIVFTGGLNLLSVHYLTLDIADSLFFGKLIGILLFTWLAVKLGFGALPARVKMVHIAGIGLLGGIGFTMSVFISNLAYIEMNVLNSAKMGILLGSLVSGVLGYLLLRRTLKLDELTA